MIKKILEDWNNRVGGNLNHKKESHLFELGSMLWEQGWSSEQIGELVKNIVEQETQFKGRTKKGDLRYFKSKDSLDKALEKGTVEPVEEPDKKDDAGTYATDEDNFLFKVLKNLTEKYENLITIADVALDPYTSHGHDGIVSDNKVLNDETNIALKDQATL